MKQNTKHNIASLVVVSFGMLLGYFCAEYGQLKGLFAGTFGVGFAYLILVKWFPKEVKE